MNAREKYIQELEKYLVTLPAAERADAVDFYNEFIEDAHYDTREQIVAELGTPRQLSHQILADYSIKANEKDGGAGKPASTKSSWRVFWPGSAGRLPDLYSVRLLDYPPVGTGNREPF